jgi:hypothetical protein
MADEKPPPDFMSALGTEYFALQSTASSTISESGSRVSIYLFALASGLVALGFSSSSPHAFASLAFTVLPTVFVLGWFTVVRLIDTSVANVADKWWRTSGGGAGRRRHRAGSSVAVASRPCAGFTISPASWGIVWNHANSTKLSSPD